MRGPCPPVLSSLGDCLAAEILASWTGGCEAGPTRGKKDQCSRWQPSRACFTPLATRCCWILTTSLRWSSERTWDVIFRLQPAAACVSSASCFPVALALRKKRGHKSPANTFLPETGSGTLHMAKMCGYTPSPKRVRTGLRSNCCACKDLGPDLPGALELRLGLGVLGAMYVERGIALRWVDAG